MTPVTLHRGDCLEVLKTLADCSIDAVVTDPPYGLEFMGKEWDAPWKASSKSALFGKRERATPGWGSTRNANCIVCHGRMRGAKKCACETPTWDEDARDTFSVQMHRFQDWCESWATELLRVLKPGGHMVAFSGTRTYHRMVCAIEDAGFEIRNQIFWCYAQGFPKSLNVNKALCGKICDCERAETLSQRDLRSVRGSDVSETVSHGKERGEVLFPCVPEQGSSSSGQEDGSPFHDRADKSGLEGWGDVSQAPRELREREICPLSVRVCGDGASRWLRDGASLSDGETHRSPTDAGRVCASSRPRAAEQRPEQSGIVARQSQPQERGAWPICERCGKSVLPDGIGTALKPAVEPICLARKPLSEPTVAANVLRWGTGALNIDATRIDGTPEATRFDPRKHAHDGYRMNATGADCAARASPLGRWPANLCHDGSQEVLGLFPESEGNSNKQLLSRAGKTDEIYGQYAQRSAGGMGRNDSGSAARFFYCAKAGKADRAGSKHPTVKPVALMRWLCRMITPPGGTILDPFAGSGTTGQAALEEGFCPVLIEREDEYADDIERRLGLKALSSIAAE